MVEIAKALPHASSLDLLDCLKRIKSYVLLSKSKRPPKTKRSKAAKNSKKTTTDGATVNTDDTDVVKTNQTRQSVTMRKETHLHHPESRDKFDALMHYLHTLDVSITAIQANQIVRIFTSSSMQTLLSPWARQPSVPAAVFIRYVHI